MSTQNSDRTTSQFAWATLGAVALGGLLGATMLTRQPITKPNLDSAPDRTARQARLGRMAVVGRTVTINRPRTDVYDFWRDPANMPAFMEHLDRVTDMGDGTYRWIMSGPAGLSVTLDTRIVSDRPGEEIVWKSVETSPIESEGRVTFLDAPGDRGTEVEAMIIYKPLLGELGRVVSILAGRDPATQGRRALKRLKMLMETGEIATSRNRREAEKE